MAFALNHVGMQTLTDLIALPYTEFFSTGAYAFLSGQSDALDGTPGIYIYISTATDTPDQFYIVKPTAFGENPGRWFRVNQFVQVQSDWDETDDTVKSFILNKPVIPDTPSASIQSHTLNANFQATTSTRNMFGVYTVSISVTSTLLGTNSGTVFLEISADGSTGWVTISQTANSIVGVVSTNAQTQIVAGLIPANYFARLRTAQSGTNGATITYITGQETLL